MSIIFNRGTTNTITKGSVLVQRGNIQIKR